MFTLLNFSPFRNMHRYMVILWSCCQATQCMVMVFDTNMLPWSNGNTYMSEGICMYKHDHAYDVGEWEVDIVTTQSTLNMQVREIFFISLVCFLQLILNITQREGSF